MDSVTLISIIKAIVAVVLGIYISESAWVEKKVHSELLRYGVGIAITLFVAAILCFVF